MGNSETLENEEKFNSLMDEYNLLLSQSDLNMKEQKTISILESLDIDEKFLKQKIKNLSGGQKTKLRLAECLSKKADIYLLDEPTNNLDLKTKEWLENYLNENISSLIVISHDRYFLNKTVDKVWDLENKNIELWKCSFQEYLEKKKKYLQDLEKEYSNAMKEKKRLLDSSKEKRKWASVNRSKKLRILADRLERDAKKYDDVVNPHDFVDEISINFSGKNLHNCEVFRLENVTQKFENILFANVNLEIEFGEKVCIMGENGSGKSTLLKMLAGKLSPTQGNSSKRKDLNIGYFDQELSDIDSDQGLMEFLVNETGKEEEKLFPLILKYGFKKDDVHKKIKYFSGGEKGRINILRISLGKNQVLILDEPTNNLDIYLMDSLEKAINEFPGTVVFVSHDRYFVNHVSTRILKIENNHISSFRGNYADLLDFKKRTS